MRPIYLSHFTPYDLSFLQRVVKLPIPKNSNISARLEKNAFLTIRSLSVISVAAVRLLCEIRPYYVLGYTLLRQTTLPPQLF